jgi:hypothetical protein
MDAVRSESATMEVRWSFMMSYWIGTVSERKQRKNSFGEEQDEAPVLASIESTELAYL